MSGYVPCNHCRVRDQTVRLWRLPGIHPGPPLRPLCQKCADTFAAMGFNIRAAAA